MSKKISFFSTTCAKFSIGTSLLYTYGIFTDKYVYIGFFICMMIIVIMTTMNSLYLLNIKGSLLEKMNIKKKSIYEKLYLWGMLSYLPLLIVVVIYSFYDFSKLGLVGIELIIMQPINMILVAKNKNVKGVMIISTIAIISLSILYMVGLTKVMNG